MGLKWWLKFVAQCLGKLIILVVFFLGLMRLVLVYPDAALVICVLVTLDFALYFRTPGEERQKYRWEWFPIGDGFYMAWKTRKRGETKWTI